MYSYISNAHPAFIDALYTDYKNDATSVDISWQKFFEGFDFALQANNNTASANGKGSSIAPQNAAAAPQIQTELRVYRLIDAYRQRGHLLAQTNPIRPRRDRQANLDLANFGLSDADLNHTCQVGSLIGLPNATLQQIYSRLQTIYCDAVGFEYGYITDPETLAWLQQRIESRSDDYGFSLDKKKHILNKLNDTVVFEQFLHKKFIGQKRFSLEGGESTIPALDAIINHAASLGVEEVVFGMAHRGRLNVLANIMRKTYEYIFYEFEGMRPDDTMGDGDVKYHLGFSSQVDTPADKHIYLKLLPNPSHLEAVNPVVQGYTRSKADAIYAHDFDKIMPVLIHGDSAVAGQGIIYETQQMCRLEGYEVGGTIHYVINNQVGFTTDFDDARSADYCTSIAAMVKAPVIHVNGDDVEAVVYAAELATEYRQRFNSDVYIDMVCYRKHGHNESDDPQFTQPDMYKLIASHPNPREIYSAQLAKRNEIEAALAQEMDSAFWNLLQERLDLVKQRELPYVYQKPELAWKKMGLATDADFETSPITGINKDTLNLIVEGLSRLPQNFVPLPKVQKMLETRRKQMADNKSLDWAAAELIAYSTILLDGNNVRMSGQDVKRGTFSHRHAVLFDETAQRTDPKDKREYNRLNHFKPEQGKFLIYNSLLSEYAVLGFEFGYSIATPESLSVWEAQFGDFSNGAQIIIDQFLSSSESKWGIGSGMVLLLPHGYEGQGPEHSSARLERYLQLSAELNMCVVNITDPANFFHAIRRQLTWNFRKPLVVMSPKWGLRAYPESSIYDIIGETRFREIIDDSSITAPKQVRRLVLCSGKIYYDLRDAQEKGKVSDVAIVRLEQLYPLPQTQLRAILDKYSEAEICWVQEEPENMGAWWHIGNHLRSLSLSPRVIARKRSASPATGYSKLHPKEQAALVNKALE
jgi:2-oxoglutarate dehydrogenase E1 component